MPSNITTPSLIKFCLACICNRHMGKHLGMSSHQVHRKPISKGFTRLKAVPIDTMKLTVGDHKKVDFCFILRNFLLRFYKRLYIKCHSGWLLPKMIPLRKNSRLYILDPSDVI